MAAPDSWPTLEQLLQEESEIVLPTLSENFAYNLGRRATDAAWNEGLTVVVGIWRGEHQLFHAALPGSTQDNDEWLRRKGRVVQRFEHSSLYMGQLCRDYGTNMSEKFMLPSSQYAMHGGAIPLRVHDAGVVGWMGVSGLPQLDDHTFAVRILRAELGETITE
ncbi:heme-degrading domain-containing protein [Knoellia sp. CPCC 206453]|uniref:heme-degrading domain-containing protein n=1 Tax=Knoellia pratensis TaxID=3404796 RepID=UPI0036100CD4